MTYVYLDPDRIKSIISDLTSYATDAENKFTDIKNKDTTEGNPVYDMLTYSSSNETALGELDSAINELQVRLDAAKSANENGISFTQPDGAYGYYLPDGVEDTAENVKRYNTPDPVQHAEEDWADCKEQASLPPSRQDWTETVPRMQSRQASPAYSARIVEASTPGEILDLTGKAVTSSPKTSFAMVPGSAKKTVSPDLFPELMASIVSTASRTWSDEQSSQYVSRLLDAVIGPEANQRLHSLARILLAPASPDAARSNDGTRGTRLRYKPEFLAELARRLEGLSAPTAPGREADGLTFEATTEIVKQDHDAHAALGAQAFAPSEEARRSSANALAGVTHAMTGNPEAARQWLAVPRGESIDKELTARRVNEIVSRRPLGHNQWTEDWAQIVKDSADAAPAGSLGPAIAAGVCAAARNLEAQGVPVELSEDASRVFESVSVGAPSQPAGGRAGTR